MLAAWLDPVPVSSFVETHLHRQAFARPGSARAAVGAFDWDTFGRLLAAEPPADLLAVGRGRLSEAPPPRTLAEARALMAAGVGFVARRAERQDAGLAALAAAFSRDLPGETHVQLFVTPAGTHSFGWHYDFEDVFIVQTAGAKDYFFRENTVDLATPRGARPDFTAVRRENTPTATARLLPGDWLYIPARWWHVALCLEDSLSISLGVFPAVGAAAAAPASP